MIEQYERILSIVCLACETCECDKCNVEEIAKRIIDDTKAEAIDDVFKKAETIQLEQIEDLNKSTKRNGKMWARYMITYLGHIQVACKRMLELKENK